MRKMIVLLSLNGLRRIKMKINLSAYENLCKDKRQPIIVSQDRRSDCKHRAQNIVRQNNLRSAVRQYKVDGNIIIDGNKCDYIVLNDDLKTAYLIELKGNDIHHAIKQLEDTLNIMKSNLSDYTFFLRIAYTGKCTHTVRDNKTIRWKKGHGTSKDGTAIADLKRSPYEENI